jgi:hypothetical protein
MDLTRLLTRFANDLIENFLHIRHIFLSRSAVADGCQFF